MVLITGAVETEIIIKVIYAAILGTIIGIEREFDSKPAGLRTHALVCMGSALFASLSVAYIGENVDPTRIAAGIVTGIGFLGAGTIFVSKDSLKGLTTAADLWVIAGIGLSVGFGLFIVAFATTISAYIILVAGRLLKKEEEKFKLKKNKSLKQDD